MSPLENAEHRVIAARGRLRAAALAEPTVPEGTIDAAIDFLVFAVEASCAARIRADRDSALPVDTAHHRGMTHAAALISPTREQA